MQTQSEAACLLACMCSQGLEALTKRVEVVEKGLETVTVEQARQGAELKSALSAVARLGSKLDAILDKNLANAQNVNALPAYLRELWEKCIGRLKTVAACEVFFKKLVTFLAAIG